MPHSNISIDTRVQGRDTQLLEYDGKLLLMFPTEGKVEQTGRRGVCGDADIVAGGRGWGVERLSTDWRIDPRPLDSACRNVLGHDTKTQIAPKVYLNGYVMNRWRLRW